MKHLSSDDELGLELGALTEALGLELPAEEIGLLLRHLDLVLVANEQLNLTRIVDPSQAIRLHVLDSLACVSEVSSAPEGQMVDLGSGAGYPGVPVAIVTGRQGVLVESTRKKSAFLQAAVSSLGLETALEVYSGRAEELGRLRPGEFSVATARAVSSLAALVELAGPLLRTEGVLVALKGTPDREELERGERAASIVGMEPLSSRAISLPGGDERRTIIAYLKVGDPDIALPRADGRAQSRPLG